jgi:hypothetical protein
MKHGCCLDHACTDETCMQLPPGATCGDCRHLARCDKLFGRTGQEDYCDFFPRRFSPLSSILSTPSIPSIQPATATIHFIKPQPAHCIVCGCTDKTPCVIDDDACSWMFEPEQLCTAWSGLTSPSGSALRSAVCDLKCETCTTRTACQENLCSHCADILLTALMTCGPLDPKALTVQRARKIRELLQEAAG